MRPWKPSAWCRPANDLIHVDHMLSSMLWHDESATNSRSWLPSFISSRRDRHDSAPPPGTCMLPFHTPLEPVISSYQANAMSSQESRWAPLQPASHLVIA